MILLIVLPSKCSEKFSDFVFHDKSSVDLGPVLPLVKRGEPGP
jgi:hypothetical protein